MNHGVKISGRKHLVAQKSEKKWKLSLKPGGWIIARSSEGIQKKLAFCKKGNQISASVNGMSFHGEILSEIIASDRELRAESDLIAQFPGKIRKVLVNEKTTVNEGDLLILIEAMKMEFSIRAPFAGKIKKIFVSEGHQIQPGDRLLDMEATGSV
jgi:3-methylcrotonyl-CoA carboxylase alpha subunit